VFRFNPGKEQRIFPKKHPYFPKGCGDCGLNQYAVGKGKPQCAVCNAFKDINESFDEFRKLAKEYNLTRFDFYSGGYIATHPSHNFVFKIQKIKDAKKNTTYTPIHSSGDIEIIVANNLCDQGGKVIFQKEKGNNYKTGDIRFKGEEWDIKYCNTFNEESIRKIIKNASEQADNIIFYSDFEEKIINTIKSAAGRDNFLIDIYFMKKDGDLIKIKKRELLSLFAYSDPPPLARLVEYPEGFPKFFCKDTLKSIICQVFLQKNVIFVINKPSMLLLSSLGRRFFLVRASDKAFF